MSKLVTQCPRCKTEFEVEKSWIGQQKPCPACNQTFAIAVRVQPPAFPPAQPKPVPKAVTPRVIATAVPPAQPKPVPKVVVPGKNAPEKREEESLKQPKKPGGVSQIPRKWRIVGLCLLVGLALLGAGGYFGCLKYEESKKKQEEERREKEERKKREEEIRIAEAERKKQEALRKAEAEREAKQRAEADAIRAKQEAEQRVEQEARQKAEFEAARAEQEAKRKADQEERLKAQREKEEKERENQRRAERKKKLTNEWDAARRDGQTDKLFITVCSAKNANLLLFRYDQELADMIDKAIFVRNDIARYNDLVRDVIFYHGIGKRGQVARIRTDYGLCRMERESSETVNRLQALSEEIADLAAKKELLVKKFEIPSDGFLDEEIPPGKYIIVYLPDDAVGCKYVFEKEKEQPQALDAEKKRWNDLSGQSRYYWDPKNKRLMEGRKDKDGAGREAVERNGRWIVKEKNNNGR